MYFAETRIKSAMSAITALWFVLTLGLALFRHGHILSTHKPRTTQLLSQISFIGWTAIPYRYAFVIDGFKAQVKQWAADTGPSRPEDPICQNPDASIWKDSATSTFQIVIILLLLLYLVYTNLFSGVHRSLETLYESYGKCRTPALGHESELYFNSEDKRRVKKVTFQLPEPESHSKASFIENVYEKVHQVMPCKRQIVQIFVCLICSIFMLPKAAQHAFPMRLLTFHRIAITSDHIIAAFLLFTGLELARIMSWSFSSPSETYNIRFAISRFIEAYGIFLVISSVLLVVQANDTMKLYIYKIFAPCAHARRWHSFYDIRVPNENLFSAILGETMMKYTNEVLEGLKSQDQKALAIDDAIDLFTRVLGDCVTVLLFATLVLVPGTLASVVTKF
ncbi:hypothetical protein OY671_001503 [Metschnikowia pulcherrima]|nr:hypothetical protein OY671_001503 [Metschnikowia pulcherrima]